MLFHLIYEGVFICVTGTIFLWEGVGVAEDMKLSVTVVILFVQIDLESTQKGRPMA